jgi:hypothetical protein
VGQGPGCRYTLLGATPFFTGKGAEAINFALLELIIWLCIVLLQGHNLYPALTLLIQKNDEKQFKSKRHFRTVLTA